MKPKIQSHQKIQNKSFWLPASAWLMTFITLIGVIELGREPVVVMNTSGPVYPAVNNISDLWTRNDNENEAVHMPAKFDVGLHIPGVAGHK